MSIERKVPGQDTTDLSSSEEEWRERLTPEQFEVLRSKGTEPGVAGAYAATKKQGNYGGAGCGHDLCLATRQSQ